ncbi:hypothetical protein [Jannaschia formosa]|uniref:hypothetical protein n=1 Tax=Jannaschia formosa TaxID=2259592 RepID=UPI001074FF9D|nr:hypothetical protein [Jannaschia formosa]TFL19220.1 hypothetical protein DR046_04635 [Jannaschia formosa]
MANELGLAFARTIVLLNGGAFAILLAYLGSASSTSAFVVSIDGLQRALSSFLLALLLMLAAILYSYVRYALPPEMGTARYLENSVVGVNAVCGIGAVICFAYGVIVLIGSTGVSMPLR